MPDPAQIASGFVANGARVYISSRSADACASVAAQLTAAGPGVCYALPEDLSSQNACERLASRLAEREPALHVLVNNSGIAWGEPLEKHSEKGLDRVFALNVKTIFFLSRALLPLLDKGSSAVSPARIINIGSIAGIRPQRFPTFGCAACVVQLRVRMLRTHKLLLPPLPLPPLVTTCPKQQYTT
jgi:NAD(P)-dependent dehydrogenase (short-subunit alcohol dehydrogenase family)